MQTTTQYYRVADHLFALSASPEQLSQFEHLAPFKTDETAGTHVFKLLVTQTSLPSKEGWQEVFVDRSDVDMPRIELYQRGGERLILLSQDRDSEVVCAIRYKEGNEEAEVCYLQPDVLRFAVDNATMLLFAFRTVAQKTLLFHASVIVREGKGFLFLGHSGTGKSTHSRMWLETFDDAELLNDDNPVVRLLPDGSVRVYGSPWSGKTPCYKQQEAPVGALVQLEQASENTIERLRMSQAYPFLLASVSGLKIEKETMDALYESLAALLEQVPVFKLRCLPNHYAARLCAQTCLS